MTSTPTATAPPTTTRPGTGPTSATSTGSTTPGTPTAPTGPTVPTPTTPGPTQTGSGGPSPTVPPGAAITALGALPVKGRAPSTGYERELFGDAWTDDVEVDGGHNGCDTRNDILRRDLDPMVLKPGTQGCVAASGTLADPYTGTVIDFVRGPDSAEVQIDHVVALADAWQKGAQQLDPARRIDFANDPLNLLAVQGAANQSKGAGDAATWLPAQRGFRCEYVARQIAVKGRYDLWVTAAERDAMATILGDCPGQPLPSTTDTSVPVTVR
ncbi:DUF1524 domain-containing protein [Nakamurella sp. YIM 132087]|uniref:DUF1524 domain-containing protein n=1 Tax=Nakamurella alba TaxID=2665158 RepID=A0A7K1FMS7_9ACTN|nr:DUF1524 domain-containing protein [Nakamurella alba]